MKLIIAELDCFMLTFDEPNAELNWAINSNIVPWMKRVHGVVGFDSAHKACALTSSTDYLITIDGDNQINPGFLDLELDVPIRYSQHVLSWNSINAINGLQYGNGGVKIWPKEYILNMRTHENADNTTSAVDFCWDTQYLQLAAVFSTTYPNASPLQAFRAGFREGCKMTLHRGEITSHQHLLAAKVDSVTLTRLLAWGSLGRDVENGVWAMLGTRVGMHYTNIQRRDITIVRDYVKFREAIADEWLHLSDVGVDHMINQLTLEIERCTGVVFHDFTPSESVFIKTLHNSLGSITNPLLTETEVLQCMI